MPHLPHTTMKIDFHTHRLDATPGTAVVSLPADALLQPDRWLDADGRLPHAAEGAMYSAGIHPWWTSLPEFDAPRWLSVLQRLAALPEVRHIGECGIDTLRGAGVEVQQRLFVEQAALAEALQKPLTIHCVRAFDRLLALHKELQPAQRWTIHGFRGRPELARQLLRAGFDLSFGPRRNEQSWALTPPDRRHEETDDDPSARVTP